MIAQNRFRLSALLSTGLVWLVLMCSVLLAGEVAVIRVQYRQAAEVLPVVQSMLSATGSVKVSKRTNSLVIVDTPEAIERVHAYLDRFDRPVEQVRIHVRFHASAEGNQRAAAVRGRVSNDDLSVATGTRKQDGVTVFFEDRRREKKSYSEFFVVAMSGSPAFVRVGEEIPYHQSPAFYRRHAPGDGTLTWHTVESGFEVTPTIVGDHVTVKIVPRIAYDDRKDAVIRFFGAQTELTAPLGQWVEIGRAADQKNEIIKEILSRGRRAGNVAVSMSLMVERP